MKKPVPSVLKPCTSHASVLQRTFLQHQKTVPLELKPFTSHASELNTLGFVYAGKQDSAKPPKSSLALGDARINPFITSYRTEYAAPFPSGARIRSPLRNKMLADVADLREIYSSAFQRVGEYVQPLVPVTIQTCHSLLSVLPVHPFMSRFLDVVHSWGLARATLFTEAGGLVFLRSSVFPGIIIERILSRTICWYNKAVMPPVLALCSTRSCAPYCFICCLQVCLLLCRSQHLYTYNYQLLACILYLLMCCCCLVASVCQT